MVYDSKGEGMAAVGERETRDHVTCVEKTEDKLAGNGAT